MGKKQKTPPSKRLRKKAEDILRESPRKKTSLSKADMAEVIHELEVHQVELEMQNEELRRIQIDLHEARDRYSNLYDYAPVGYLTLALDGTILEANLTSTGIFGIERRKLIGSLLTRWIASEDRTHFMYYLNRLQHSQRRQSVEARISRNNPEPIWVRFDAVLMQQQENTPTIRLVMIDISERVRAEMKHDVINQRFHALVQTTWEGMTVFDSNGKFKYVSDSTSQLLDYSVEQLKEMNLLNLIHPDDRERVKLWFNHLEKHPGISTIKDMRIRRRDGSWVWLETTGVNLLHEPFLNGFVGNWRNITDRKRAEEKLSQLANIPRHMNDAFIVYDLDERIIYWNPAAERLYGWSESEALSLSWMDLLPEELRHEGQVIFQQRIHQRSEAVEIRLTKTGAMLTVQVTSTTLSEPGGEPYAVAFLERLPRG